MCFAWALWVLWSQVDAQPGFAGDLDFLDRHAEYRNLVSFLGTPDKEGFAPSQALLVGGTDAYAYTGYVTYSEGMRFWLRESAKNESQPLVKDGLTVTHFVIKRKNTVLSDLVTIGESGKRDVLRAWGDPVAKRGCIKRTWVYHRANKAEFNVRFSVVGKLRCVHNFTRG